MIAVDDDPNALAVVAEALESHGGHQVDLIGDPVAALDKIRSDPPDLLLVDWLMPGMSGVELLKSLSEGSANGRPKYAVMITGAPDVDLLKMVTADYGVDEIRSKPISPPVLALIFDRAEARLAD